MSYANTQEARDAIEMERGSILGSDEADTGVEMKTIKATQKAWMPDSNTMTPSEMQEHIAKGHHEYLIGRLSYSTCDMSKYGWVEIGTANINLTLHPQDEVIEKLADGLREQISSVRAEAHSKVAQLEEKLSQLLALPNPDQAQGEAA